MQIQDSNLTIMVADMDASIGFYQSIGFTLKNRWGSHYAQLTAPGINIGLHPKGESTGLSVGFTTTDFNATREALQKLSIPLNERKEEGGQFLHFTDPDGTELYFIKPKWG